MSEVYDTVTFSQEPEFGLDAALVKITELTAELEWHKANLLANVNVSAILGEIERWEKADGWQNTPAADVIHRIKHLIKGGS